MTLNKITLVAFLLFFSIRSFSADQDGRDLVDVLEEYSAQDQGDLEILEGLANSARLIKHVRISKYLPFNRDYQHMSETFCQYQVSIAFEQELSRSIGKIYSIEMKSELNELELELKNCHKTQNPYHERWPSDPAICEKMSGKYLTLFSGASDKLNKILKAYQGKMANKRDYMLNFIKNSIETKKFDGEIANAVRDLFEQKTLLEQTLGSLKSEHEQYLLQLEERKKRESAVFKGEQDQLNRLRQERQRIDSQLKNLKGLRALTQQEVDAIIRQKSDHQEQKIAQEALNRADLQQRREDGEKQIAELAARVLKKRQEADAEEAGFKVSFKKMIESSFPDVVENRVEFVGGNNHDNTFLNIKRSIENQVKIIEGHFARSREARQMKEGKEAQHRYIVNFVNLKGISGVFKNSIEGTIFITAEVIFRNIKESIFLDAVPIELEDTGDLTKKNSPLLNQLKELIYTRIPEAKKTIYDKATSPHNQQLLYNLGHSCVSAGFAPCVDYEGIVFPSAPAYPQIDSYFPGGETYDQPGDHPEGQQQEGLVSEILNT